MAHYICMSTENQTVNIIPLSYVDVDSVTILSTNFVNEKGLSVRLQNFLNSKNIKNTIYNLTDVQNTNLPEFIKVLDNIIGEFDTSQNKIIFNITGGQKIYPLACYEIFNKYPNIELIYLEFHLHKLISLSKENGKTIQNEKQYYSNLTLEDILYLYGYTYDKNDSKKIDSINDIDANFEHLMNFYNYYVSDILFRQIFLKTSYERADLNLRALDEVFRRTLNDCIPILEQITPKEEQFEQVIGYIKSEIELYKSKSGYNGKKLFKNLDKAFNDDKVYDLYWREIKRRLLKKLKVNLSQYDYINPNILVHIFSNQEELNDFKIKLQNSGGKISNTVDGTLEIYKKNIVYSYKIGELFELLILAKIIQYLNENIDIKNKVLQIWLNVKTKKLDSNAIEAEYDILFVTKFGTIVILEAKAGKFEGETAKAKSYGASSKSGPYGKSYMVVPILSSDFNEEKRLREYIPPVLAASFENLREHGLEHILLDELEDKLKKILK